LVNHTSITVGNGLTLTLNGSGLDNEGTATLTGGTITGVGPLVNNALVNGGNLTLSNSGANSNVGIIDISAGFQLKLTGGNLANSGAINLSGGTVSGTAILNNTTGNVSGHGTISAPFSTSGLLIVDAGILNITHAFANSGEIRLNGGSATLTATGTLTNNGGALINGTGRVNNNLTNAATGTIRVTGNERLVFTGATNLNNGNFELVSGTQLGGDVVFDSPAHLFIEIGGTRMNQTFAFTVLWT
jgi:hypothetical protein